MNFALQNTAIEKFPEYNPDEWKDEDWMKKPMLNGKLDMEKDVKVCEIPGKNGKYCLANEYCRDKDVKKKDFINAHEILYYVNRDDPHGDIPDKPDRDAQYKTWEDGVKDWYKKNKDKGSINESAPEEKCQKDDFSKYLPEISLSAPGNAGSSFSVEANADAPYGVEYVKIYADGDEIASSGNESASKTIDASGKNGSTITIRAVIRDKNGNENETEKDVSVSF